jgi:hypothetical protein
MPMRGTNGFGVNEDPILSLPLSVTYAGPRSLLSYPCPLNSYSSDGPIQQGSVIGCVFGGGCCTACLAGYLTRYEGSVSENNSICQTGQCAPGYVGMGSWGNSNPRIPNGCTQHRVGWASIHRPCSIARPTSAGTWIFAMRLVRIAMCKRRLIRHLPIGLIPESMRAELGGKTRVLIAMWSTRRVRLPQVLIIILLSSLYAQLVMAVELLVGAALA